MIRITTKNNEEYFSSDFTGLDDALGYISNLKPSDSFYAIRTNSEEKEQRIPPHLLMRG